jgi:predicted kinase
MATLYLMVGLPGAGKTTRARELAAEHRAVWLSPDVWMLALFGEPEAGSGRDVLEGRLLSVALQVLRTGSSVVLDFGLWGRDERSALRALGAQLGAEVQLVYLPVDPPTQRERIRRRWGDTPEETFPMTEDDVERARASFEPPDAAELSGGDLLDPPPGSPDWGAWAAARWPSSDRSG